MKFFIFVFFGLILSFSATALVVNDVDKIESLKTVDVQLSKGARISLSQFVKKKNLNNNQVYSVVFHCTHSERTSEDQCSLAQVDYVPVENR
jgi:hypothetical protein